MKTCLLFSGGLDSSVALFKLLSEGDQVFCLNIDYGQRHQRETSAAESICQDAGVAFKNIKMPLAEILDQSSLINRKMQVPEGHYAEENMKATVVPNRNMVLLSLAIAYAINQKADRVTYAAHAGDHSIYPDCRPEFIETMQQAAKLCDWHPIKIYAPFMHLSKTEVVKIGLGLDVPFEKTWSCYNGRELHCGKCGTCVERKEAFAENFLKDPTHYEA